MRCVPWRFAMTKSSTNKPTRAPIPTAAGASPGVEHQDVVREQGEEAGRQERLLQTHDEGVVRAKQRRVLRESQARRDRLRRSTLVGHDEGEHDAPARERVGPRQVVPLAQHRGAGLQPDAHVRERAPRVEHVQGSSLRRPLWRRPSPRRPMPAGLRTRAQPRSLSGCCFQLVRQARARRGRAAAGAMSCHARSSGAAQRPPVPAFAPRLGEQTAAPAPDEVSAKPRRSPPRACRGHSWALSSVLKTVILRTQFQGRLTCGPR